MFLHRRVAAVGRSLLSGIQLRKTSRSVLEQAVRPVVDDLESRQLLTVTTLPGSVIVEGNGYDPISGLPSAVQHYVFETNDGTRSRVTVGGTARVHLLFATNPEVMDPQPPIIQYGAPLPDNDEDPANGLIPKGDIFSIYIEEGDLDSWVAISEISTGNNPQPQPFSDNVSLRVNGAMNPFEITTDGGTGALLLGTLTLDTVEDTDDDEARPVFSTPLSQPFGDLDAGDTVIAGLRVASGVNIGRFLFGGTITGVVDINSMELFYAGNVLTGTTNNQLGFGIGTPDNFRVRGDLRNFIVTGSVGTLAAGQGMNVTAPSYNTGFDMEVDGKLGMAYAANHFFGGVHVVNGNSPNRIPAGRVQHEIESRITRLGTITDPLLVAPTSVTANWVNGWMSDNSFWNDDTASPHYLGDVNGEIHLEGTLQALTNNNAASRDYLDIYGVSLMSGQAVEFELDSDLLFQIPGLTTPINQNFLQVGIMDPDGRVVASDYSDVDYTNLGSVRFRFVADVPGVYRIVVASPGDLDFNGPGGDRFGVGGYPISNVGAISYRLHLWNVGNIGIGGLGGDGRVLDTVTGGTVVITDPDDPIPPLTTTAASGWLLDNGDFGALHAGGILVSAPTQLLSLLEKPAATVRVLRGNLRSVSAGQMGTTGTAQDTSLGAGPELDVPLGSVGEVRSDGILALNTFGVLVAPTANGLPGSTFLFNYVGRDYQRIITTGTGALGSVQNGKFYGAIIAYGGLGTLQAGNMFTASPSVITVNADQAGKDGIIELIDIRGDFGTLGGGGPWITTGRGGNLRYLNVEGNLFLDQFFGGGSPQNTVYPAGQGDRFRDDSGAQVEVNPTGGGVLQVLTYGIRGSGGVAIVRAQSSSGVTIEALGRTVKGGAEIGKIVSSGANSNVTLEGRKRVDVLYIQGTAGLNDVVNDTTGEIVSIRSGSINNLEAQSIGFARKSSRGTPTPGDILSNAYPFVDARTGVLVTGNINEVRARGALGNVSATGNIDTVVANSDSRPTKRSVDGIVGSVFAGGNIDSVNIGQGLMPSGNGFGAAAGIFANGTIDEVEGTGNADIRGHVISQTRINTIRLRGGSIINSNIGVFGALGHARELSAKTLSDDGDSFSNPSYEIGQILVQGGGPSRGRGSGKTRTAQGGIIGSNFIAADIGTVRVQKGFGIFNSQIFVQGDGRLDTIQTDGYGLRDVFIGGGSLLRQVIVEGKGNRVKTTTFSTSVRRSEGKPFDAQFLFRPNRLTDIHRVLGTSKAQPSRGDVTRTGVIAGIDARGGRNANRIEAFELRGSFTVNPLTNLPLIPSSLNIANSIEDLILRRDVRDVSITTGRIGLFRSGRDMTGTLNATIAGTIDELRIGRDLGTNAVISAVGPDGDIEELFVGRNVNGSITAEEDILIARVRGSVNGTLADKDGPVTPRR